MLLIHIFHIIPQEVSFLFVSQIHCILKSASNTLNNTTLELESSILHCATIYSQQKSRNGNKITLKRCFGGISSIVLTSNRIINGIMYCLPEQIMYPPLYVRVLLVLWGFIFRKTIHYPLHVLLTAKQHVKIRLILFHILLYYITLCITVSCITL